MKIKVLGSGCKSCMTLTENTKKALEMLNIEAEVEKITDFVDIAKYGIMSTPGLVIDEKVVAFGKVLKPKDIVKIIQKVID